MPLPRRQPRANIFAARRTPFLFRRVGLLPRRRQERGTPYTFRAPARRLRRRCRQRLTRRLPGSRSAFTRQPPPPHTPRRRRRVRRVQMGAVCRQRLPP